MTNQAPIMFSKEIEVRWADCDANNHMRHSAYSDFCAHTRIGFLEQIGLGMDWCQNNHIGPVLFKEETEYAREVHMGEVLTVTISGVAHTGFTKSVQLSQQILKQNGEVAALHKCVVAWMDLEKRKIIELPEPIKKSLTQ